MGAERTDTSVSEEWRVLFRESLSGKHSPMHSERYERVSNSQQFMRRVLENHQQLAGRIMLIETPAERERRLDLVQHIRNDLRTAQVLMVDPRPVGWFFGKLSARFQQTVHDRIAHPLSEFLFDFGFRKLADFVHDATVPAHLRVSVGG